MVIYQARVTDPEACECDFLLPDGTDGVLSCPHGWLHRELPCYPEYYAIRLATGIKQRDKGRCEHHFRELYQKRGSHENWPI
jgi:hypothetical protein